VASNTPFRIGCRTPSSSRPPAPEKKEASDGGLMHNRGLFTIVQILHQKRRFGAVFSRGSLVTARMSLYGPYLHKKKTAARAPALMPYPGGVDCPYIEAVRWNLELFHGSTTSIHPQRLRRPEQTHWFEAVEAFRRFNVTASKEHETTKLCAHNHASPPLSAYPLRQIPSPFPTPRVTTSGPLRPRIGWHLPFS
jgi:hypothetical protein